MKFSVGHYLLFINVLLLSEKWIDCDFEKFYTLHLISRVRMSMHMYIV